MMIKAPWTDEQVDALTRWQLCGFVHEFTCPREHGDGVQISMVLIPNKSGWTCPCCDYTKDWAHDFMFQEQHNPLDRIWPLDERPYRFPINPMDAVRAGQLPIWTVYHNPADYPDKYVARMHLSDVRGSHATANIIIADDLETIRQILLADLHLTCLERDPNDDPMIVENWL